MANNRQQKPVRYAPDRIKEFPVNAPVKLMEHLSASMPDRKRTFIKQLLSHNQVAVNGRPESQFDLELQPSDSVKVNFTHEFKVFNNRRLKIVYEDDDIIVVEKGYGLLSMGNDKKPDIKIKSKDSARTKTVSKRLSLPLSTQTLSFCALDLMQLLRARKAMPETNTRAAISWVSMLMCHKVTHKN